MKKRIKNLMKTHKETPRMAENNKTNAEFGEVV